MNPALLPYAVTCTALYAGLGLLPLAQAGMGWGDALTLLPGRVLSGDLPALLLALPLGFFWLGAAWPKAPAARVATAVVLFLTLGLLAALLLLGQIHSPPRLVEPGGLIAPWAGCAAGMLLWGLLGTRLGRREPPAWLWPALVAFTALSALIPLDPGAPLNAPALPGAPYFTDLPQRVYGLIKSAMLWAPVGFLYTLSGDGKSLPRWGLALVAAWLLEGLPWLGTQPLRESMELLFALPGLWAGAWMGERSLLLASTIFREKLNVLAPVFLQAVPCVDAGSVHGRGAAQRPEVAAIPEQPIATKEAAAPESGRTSHHGHHKHRPHESHPLRWLAGLLLLLAGAAGLAAFPLWQWGLSLGLILYAAVLWAWPLAWLVVVPAALPLLDLAPWSGRFFFDEFDLLMLTTAGTLLLRGRKWPAVSPPPAWLALCGLSVLVSLALGLGSAPPLDANAFSSYWSPYNALRVAKGFAWGGTLFALLRLTRPEPGQLADRLALGMGLGLLGVGLVGVWERWLFAGFGDGNGYRIVSTFSSMHIGGGHIEAYLAAALPFLWLGMTRSRWLLLTVPIMVLTAYVTIFTVARGGVLAMGLVLLILGAASLRLAWLNRSRTKTPSLPLARGAGEGWRIQAALPMGVLALLAVGLLTGIGGDHFQQRLGQSGSDWQIRVDHWKRSLSMMDATPMAQLFGMGLGSFPRVYLERGPAQRQAATFGFLTEKDKPFLRLGSGDTLYYAQRVAVKAGADYHLSLWVRSRQANAHIGTPICEKQLLNSRRCLWLDFAVPEGGRWQRLSRDFSSGAVGVQEGLQRPPVELSLFYPGKTGEIDVSDVQLLDRNGRNLIGNGDFSMAGDYWFFATHSHLPWHIKNVWVHVLFEQGWVGLLLFLGLSGYALFRLAGEAWRGQRLAWTLLASLSGLLTVGVFDSLFDAPRLATLLIAFILIGLAHDWAARPLSHYRVKRKPAAG